MTTTVLENLVLQREIQELCVELHKQFHERSLSSIVKELINIYIKNYSCVSNIYVPTFINSRLQKIYESPIKEKIICELFCFLALQQTTNVDYDNILNESNNIVSVEIPSISVYKQIEMHLNKRDFKSCEECVNYILKFKGNNFDDALCIKSTTINDKYKKDSVWWLWFKLYNSVSSMMINDGDDVQRMIKQFILENYKIFRFEFNNTNRSKRIVLLKTVLMLLCSKSSTIYESNHYNPYLIQIMLKINLLQPINKKFSIYKNFLYTFPPREATIYIQNTNPIMDMKNSPVKSIEYNNSNNSLSSKKYAIVHKLN